MTNTTEREAFEKFMANKGYAVSYIGDGQYEFNSTQLNWEVWQAANAIQSHSGGEARQCKCNMRTKLVGDGCQICNPQLVIDLLSEEVSKLTATNAKLVEQVRVMREALERRKNGSVIDMENTFQGNFRDYTR